MDSKIILVNGGAGFIGSHTCEALLDKGHSVICVDDFKDFYNPKIKEENLAKIRNNNNFKLYKADIRDAEAMGRVF